MEIEAKTLVFFSCLQNSERRRCLSAINLNYRFFVFFILQFFLSEIFFISGKNDAELTTTTIQFVRIAIDTTAAAAGLEIRIPRIFRIIIHSHLRHSAPFFPGI